ncbi:MAG: PQQ-binding-like beta-propeller repeat protein [Candidatus Krumholzibacteriia bacterium]
MIHRELAFYPETERTRDLIYSEYTSCNRSIHVLMQDAGLPNYRFLLDAYRELVRRYASVSRLESATAFLAELAVRLEELSLAANFNVADLRATGFYVLVRATDAYYLMTSKDDGVYLHAGGELLGLADLPEDQVERLHFAGGGLQEELFPQRLRDCFLLFRLDRDCVPGRDILLGCGEEAKSAVIEALNDPGRAPRGRDSVSSKFITHKILSVRFERHLGVAEGPRRRLWPAAWALRKERVAVAGALAALVVVAGLWAGGRLGGSPGEDGGPGGVITRPEKAESANIAPEPVEVPLAWETVRLAERWRHKRAEGVTSSPVGYANRVIYGARDGGVYAVDGGSGEVAWTAKGARGIGATPAIGGTAVVVADYGGQVRALDAGTGDERWRAKLGQRIVSSPAIMDDRVLVGCYDAYAYCLGMKDGRVLWRRKTGGRIRGSIGAAGDMFYVPSYDGYVYALAATTGEVRWRRRLGGSIASAAVAHGQWVIVGAPGGEVYALAAENGSVRWSYRTGGAVKSWAAVAGGRVYVGSNDRSVYCLNLADGKLIWKYETGDVVLSRPAVHEGLVFVGSYDGHMYCLDAVKGTLIDRFQSGGAIYSSPLIEGGAVYFGTNRGSFVCLSPGKGPGGRGRQP